MISSLWLLFFLKPDLSFALVLLKQKWPSKVFLEEQILNKNDSYPTFIDEIEKFVSFPSIFTPSWETGELGVYVWEAVWKYSSSIQGQHTLPSEWICRHLWHNDGVAFVQTSVSLKANKKLLDRLPQNLKSMAACKHSLTHSSISVLLV